MWLWFETRKRVGNNTKIIVNIRRHIFHLRMSFIYLMGVWTSGYLTFKWWKCLLFALEINAAAFCFLFGCWLVFFFLFKRNLKNTKCKFENFKFNLILIQIPLSLSVSLPPKLHIHWYAWLAITKLFFVLLEKGKQLQIEIRLVFGGSRVNLGISFSVQFPIIIKTKTINKNNNKRKRN